MAKIFIMPVQHKKRVDAFCFDCGKILVGSVVIDGIPCFPCKQEACEHEIKREDLGQGNIAGEDSHVFFRCLDRPEIFERDDND